MTEPIILFRKMKIFGIITLSLIFISCNRERELQLVLTDQSKNALWNQKEVFQNGNLSGVINQFEFYKDGSSMAFISDNESKKGVQAVLNLESSSLGSWHFSKKDSTLQICAVCIFKVTRISQDTIFMRGKGFKGNYLLIRVVPKRD